MNDIELSNGGGTKAVQFAAFDAAVTASHILDWVLHEVDDASHLGLTGVHCHPAAKFTKHISIKFFEHIRSVIATIHHRGLGADSQASRKGFVHCSE